MKKILSTIFFAVLLIVVISAGSAEARRRTHFGVGLHFLFALGHYGHHHHHYGHYPYAPKIYLEYSDRFLLSENTNHTLETARSGEKVRWTNPETGIMGSVVARPAYKNARGQYCRADEQKLRDARLIQRGYDTACRLPDGKWENDPQR